ncbi:MAG: peptidoglycan DD-metalloendopeptidase family protein [Deltaproteobacteria bacterium]|nr:peptidoglycan DD-metalloendopeptidase family protein [Deltaproteobacteria bacterium]
MFLKGVWFIIAGIFLLAQTSVLAEPYTVCKDGVIYYYFGSRKASRSKQIGKSTPKPRGEAWIQVKSPHHHPTPAAGKVPPGEAKVKPEAVSPPLPSALMPSMPETTADLPVAHPYAAPSLISPATNHLLRWLTKIGCRYPQALPQSASLQPVRRHPEVPPQAPEIVVPEGWINLLKDAQEQAAALGLPGPNVTGFGRFLYCFPVGGPYSFRDTWGEPRSGGRIHRAVDIFAQEGTPVYAITSGAIDSLATYPGGGICLFLQGKDGKGYGYMHLQRYAPGVVRGKAVQTGEVIGYVGRTGVRNSPAHLHFQIYANHGLAKDELFNPYYFLVQLCHGTGVTDLNQQKLARLKDPEFGGKGIRVHRRPKSAALFRDIGTFSVKDSSVLVIKNY